MLKQLLNPTEAATHELLESTCREYGARVHPKVRLADIFPIEGSGISNEQYSFALKSHFDFIVAREQAPLFAVEFDGRAHQNPVQIERDRIKDQLCDRFQLPVIRINGRYIVKTYRKMDLLSWFVHCWFLGKGFEDAQENGSIPLDEPFCPTLVYSLRNCDQILADTRKNCETRPEEPLSKAVLRAIGEPFPLFLSATVREKIRGAHAKNLLEHSIPSYCMGWDEKRNLRGLTWIKVRASRWLAAHSAMRSQQFPVDQTELFDDILAFEIWGKIEVFLKTGTGLLDNEQISTLICTHEAKYPTTSSGIVQANLSAPGCM